MGITIALNPFLKQNGYNISPSITNLGIILPNLQDLYLTVTLPKAQYNSFNAEIFKDLPTYLKTFSPLSVNESKMLVAS